MKTKPEKPATSPVKPPQNGAVAPTPHPFRPQQRPRKANITRRRRMFGLLQSCISALEAVRANKLRSLLTSLGIIIGVGAVIMMISTSESNAAVIGQRLSRLNPNELVVRPGSANAGGVRQGAGTVQTLTQSDADAIIAQVPHVTAASPSINASGQVIYQNQNWSTTVQGVYPSYLQVGSWQMQEGAFISDADEQSGSSVAVIGQTVVDNLFTPQGVDPIGQQIRIRNVPFTVIGTLAPKGTSGAANADDVVYIPFSTAVARVSGTPRINSITVLVDNANNINDVQTSMEQLLEQQHGIANPQLDDFTIQNQSQILQTVQAASQSLTILLISVAAISLLVGGIGIMNIMLVSVTERTREIGIRIAIGAHPGDVMAQFLVEALMLSALGGLVGVILGVAGAFLNATFSGSPFVLDPLAVLLAFGFAAFVGIVFGFYPAQRAARMDPIVALRTE
ncbi:MAG TPA: ABC transporter permease [Ktedonosporobacter sp.]|nr:ABC transporter permease [Ktedonosporobacter sp.]